MTLRRTAFAAIGLALAAGAARAQTAVEQFYAGKTLTIVIGSNVGGGYDAYGRLVGRYLGKYMPGHPTIVFSNMTGAGGAIALNYVSSVAPRDGTTIAATSGPALLDPLLGTTRSVKADPLKFNYIGSPNEEVNVCLLRKDAAVQTFADVFTKEAIIGSSGGTTHDMPAAAMATLGARYRLIGGYAGSRDVLLATDKGEVQGLCGMGFTSVVTQRPDWLKPESPVRVLVQESLTGVPALNQAGVPLAINYAKTPEQRAVLGVVYAGLTFMRPFVMADGAPADRVAAVREAFQKAVADPDLLADARKQGLEISVATGEELYRQVHTLYATPPDIVARVKAALATP